jgi:hypothetical protein
VRKNEPNMGAWLDNRSRTKLKNGRLKAICKKFLGQNQPEGLLKTAD